MRKFARQRRLMSVVTLNDMVNFTARESVCNRQDRIILCSMCENIHGGLWAGKGRRDAL